MDAVGHRYGKRPSELWGLNGPDSLVLALAFDSEVLQKANAFEQRMMDEARGKGPEAKAERAEARKVAWAAFYESLPEDSPFKQRAKQVALEVAG